MPAVATADARRLRAAAAASSLLARTLGPDTDALVDPETHDAVVAALEAADAPAALSRLDSCRTSVSAGPSELAGRWVRWFDLGRVAPYEGSNVVSTAGGVTPRLADVAGFYKAFGLQVVDDRPDHVIAQLEFLAMALLAQAEAIESGDEAAEQETSRAIRSFLRDHLGGWIDVWASRVAAIDELEPWVPFAAAAAELVRTEATRRNVIPLSEAAVLPADAGLAEDYEAVVSCEDALED